MQGFFQVKWYLIILFFTVVESNYGQSEMNAYLKKVTELKSFSGSIVVAKKGKTLLHKGFGKADYENDVPNSGSSIHRIASLTKPMTSMAILKLFSTSDTLSVNDPISRFLPEAPSAWHQVTVFHLLTHTSGIPNHFGDLDAVPVEDTFKEIEKVFRQQKESQLRNKPGEDYRYSNFGYVLLGRIIEVVSGKNYADYLKAAVFVPLGMENTTYDDPRLIIKGRSEGYKLSGGIRMNDALKDPAAFSAGGLLSTTEDLLKWSKALKTDLILTDDVRTSMFTPYRSDYGLGWQILQKQGRKMYNHNGSTHGYNTRIVFYPEEDVFIAILGNNANIRVAAITCDLEAMIFEDPNHHLALPHSLPVSQMSAFTGSYQTEDGTERSIRLEEEKLWYVNAHSKYELMPLSDNEFCYRKYEDVRLKFIDANSYEVSYCTANPEVYRRQR